MATNENLIPIPGRLHSVATEGHVAGADEIYDDTLNKDQATINSEVNAALGEGGTVDEKIAEAIDDALEDVAFIDASESSPAVVPGFDPTTDTVHVTAQTLSETQKAQVRTNIGLGDVDARISNAVASEASQRAAAVSSVQSSVNAEASRAQAAESALQNNIEALTQSNIVVVADHTSVSSPDPLTIYREQGTNTYSDWMYQNGSWNKMAEYDNAIDDEPTAGSDNLVKSGGVYPTTSIVKGVTNEKEIAFYTDTSDRLRVAAYHPFTLKRDHKYKFLIELGNIVFNENTNVAYTLRLTTVNPISSADDPGIVAVLCNIAKEDYHTGTVEIEYFATKDSTYIFNYIGGADTNGDIKLSVVEYCINTDSTLQSPTLPANAQSVGKKFNDISENGEDEYSYLSSTIGNTKYYELYRLRKDANYHFKFEFENLSFDSNGQIALSVRATTVNPISGGDDPGIISFLVNEILKEDFDGSPIEFDYLAQESSVYIYTYIGNSITTGKVKMSVSYVQPIVDETLSTSLPAKAKTVGAAIGKLQGSIGSKSYYGDRLDLSVKKYDLENIATIIGSTNQGADVSKDKLFEAFGDGSCKVYDFNTLSSTPLYTFNFACASADNHFNCINFGPKIPQGYSFPALYISTGKVGSPLEYKCHVEGIIESGGVYTSTLLQTITFDTSDWEANGYMQIFGSPHVLIDKERGFLWVFSAKYRTLKDDYSMSNNKYIATKFEIPSLSNNQVVLSGSDILGQKIFEFTTYFTQGGTMRNGKIYYSFGLGSNEYPANVRVFNTDDSSVCTEFNSINNSEPEDMFIVNDDLYFIDSDGKVFKFVV